MTRPPRPPQGWWRPTAALDATRMGGQVYTPGDVREVMAILEHLTYRDPMTVARMFIATGERVPGRTIRQIISDLDGHVMLIGKRENGLYVCRTADEGEAYTRAMDRHYRSERDRVRRRRPFAANMPRTQGLMFDDDALYDDEDDEDDL